MACQNVFTTKVAYSLLTPPSHYKKTDITNLFDINKLGIKGGGGNVTFSVKKIGGSHTRSNFEDNDLIFFLNSQN